MTGKSVRSTWSIDLRRSRDHRPTGGAFSREHALCLLNDSNRVLRSEPRNASAHVGLGARLQEGVVSPSPRYWTSSYFLKLADLMGFHHDSCSRNHRTVSVSPSANDRDGFQSSFERIFAESTACRWTCPGRSGTVSRRDLGFPRVLRTAAAISFTECSSDAPMLKTSPSTPVASSRRSKAAQWSSTWIQSRVFFPVP